MLQKVGGLFHGDVDNVWEQAEPERWRIAVPSPRAPDGVEGGKAPGVICLLSFSGREARVASASTTEETALGDRRRFKGRELGAGRPAGLSQDLCGVWMSFCSGRTQLAMERLEVSHNVTL